MINIISFKTKIGWITAHEGKNKILLVSLSKSKNKGKSKKLLDFKKKISNFFNRKNKYLNSNIFLSGTNLQIKIWKELKKIPYGKTKSYGEIAKKLKTSPRYVGNVCGQNRHLLVIPCHRVIRSDGKLGGFSGTGGIKTKKKLLKFEGAIK